MVLYVIFYCIIIEKIDHPSSKLIHETKECVHRIILQIIVADYYKFL